MQTVPTTDLALAESRVSDSDNTKGGSILQRLNAYYELTKPGITRMVVLSGAAGYYLGIPETLQYFSVSSNIVNFLLAMFGIAFVSSGSCVLNNYAERDFDKLMRRTMQRPIPSGAVQPKAALLFGVMLAILGVAMLVPVNILTSVLAVLTLVLYVYVYTPLKRKTLLSLMIGGIPGALPALGGWTAATGTVEIESLLLFILMFMWQMPHFLALSWMYKQDYKRGRYEVLAVRDQTGKHVATQTLLFVILLIPATLALAFVQKTGIVYLVGTSVLCATFLYYSFQFLRSTTVVNARKVLLSSYLYLVGTFTMIFVDKL
ncbi:MAG: heme o synthase [Bacteroidota bacterium]|nr:heme o synthase [Candidatus Kapabacteria bacterium]MDW8220952.1 heme o synthase [Bacteroidota bacterium]